MWEKVGGGLVGSGVLRLLERYLPYLEKRITLTMFKTKIKQLLLSDFDTGLIRIIY